MVVDYYMTDLSLCALFTPFILDWAQPLLSILLGPPSLSLYRPVRAQTRPMIHQQTSIGFWRALHWAAIPQISPESCFEKKKLKKKRGSRLRARGKREREIGAGMRREKWQLSEE